MRTWLVAMAAMALLGCGSEAAVETDASALDASADDAGATDSGAIADAALDDAQAGDAGARIDGGPLPDPLPPCDVTPPAELLRRAGPQMDGSFLTLDGRRAVAAGPNVAMQGFPFDLALHPTLRVGYVVSSGSGARRLSVVDLDTRAILQDLDYDQTFYGLEVSPDGTRVYQPRGQTGRLTVHDVAADGTLTERATLNVGGYLSGTAISPDGARLWIGDFDSRPGPRQITEIDTSTLTVARTIDVPGQIWDIVHLPSRNELYLSDLAGEGIAVVDLATGSVVADIPMPIAAAGMARRPDDATVWAAVSGTDIIVAIDTTSRSITATVSVGSPAVVDGSGAPLPNSNVNALWYDAATDRLFASQGTDNAIGVFDGDTLTRLGALPSDRYPSDVELASDGRTLVVISARGAGAPPGGSARSRTRGTLATIDLDAIDLAAETVEVDASFRRTIDLYAPDCAEFPVPTAPGRPTPIEHVILILKENKTYDSILGDLDMPGAARDPSLAEWGLPITPNHHALATEFAHSDNFYLLTSISDTGHLFMTAAHMSEYAERIWQENGYTSFPLEARSTGRRRNFFTHLVENDVSLRIYGEIVGTSLIAGNGRTIASYSDPRFPGGIFTNYGVTDEAKARYVASRIRAGELAQFTFLLLPNDHTNGTAPGTPSPESMVADNDYAMGLVVEALSQSPFWARSVVFVVEDDPQGTEDHIEPHRSILHVISPWARRGYVSHVHASYYSIFATIERILGVPPMGRGDGSVAPLYDMFTTTPDYTPYDARERLFPPTMNTLHSLGAERSQQMDFRGPDLAPELGPMLQIYRRHQRGLLSRAEAEAQIEALFDQDADREIDESHEASAYLTELAELERMRAAGAL